MDRLRKALSPWGSLESDGRPTLSLSARDVVQIALEADSRCVVIPAHVWTPWFGVYGSKAGFDSLAECFGDMLPHIHAIETGLSSDPGMNWRVPGLDGMTIVSFSDAHSAPRLGREVTVFDTELTYEGFREVVTEGNVAYTLEFYPEEGKYHYDGHRKCGVHQHPEVTATQDGRCPVCKRRLTVGVASRIEDLSARPLEVSRSADGLLHGGEGRAPYRRLVALHEIIGEAMGRGPATKGVEAVYMRLVQEVAPELTLLQETSLDVLDAVAGERVAEGVGRARRGDVHIEPGYDGVYGTVSIWDRVPSADLQAKLL